MDEASPEVLDQASRRAGTAAAEEETLFQETRRALRAPETGDRKSTARFWFLFSLALYVLYRLFFAGEGLQQVPAGIALLIGAILVHEIGHFAGMRLFGYRDLRVFFIPFFGAAATGRKHAAPIWQQAIVALLGPVPGLVLAGALLLSFHPPPGSLLHNAVLLLLALNLFNLLPLVPLDGGRFLQLVVFSRTPLLEAGFGLLAYLGLGALSYFLHSMVLGVLAILGVMGLPARFRQARRRAILRSGLRGFPPRWEDLGQGEELALFRLARTVAPETADPAGCARQMRQLHEEIVVHPPGLGATAALLLVYGAAVLLGAAVIALAAERG